MNATTVGCSLLMVSVTAASAPGARLPSTYLAPPRPMILVQSELDLLPASKRLVTLKVDDARPAAFLDLLRERSGLTIEVRGALPAEPTVSGTFREVEAKELLDWFARQVRVAYRAEPPNKLSIITD